MATIYSTEATRQKLNGIDSLRTNDTFAPVHYQDYFDNLEGVAVGDVLILARLPDSKIRIRKDLTIFEVGTDEEAAVVQFEIGTVSSTGVYTGVPGGGSLDTTTPQFWTPYSLAADGGASAVYDVPVTAEWLAIKVNSLSGATITELAGLYLRLAFTK